MKKILLLINLIVCSLLIFCVSSCSVNKADIDNDLKQFFESQKVDGCFTMLNNADGKITVYNLGMDTTRFSPKSTFKILNSLIALQTGAVTDENMVIKWDSVDRKNPDWNKDMDMKEAFKLSCLPFYQEVARRIGEDKMKTFIDSISYGNKNIEGPIDSFWLNNKLKISPDEQLGLLKKLYFDQLPFRKSVQQTVRDMMVREDNTAYKLSYKTGWGYDENNQTIGWVTGWIEENRHVYFFVTLVKSPDKNIDITTIRMNVTKNILSHYGFFKGKK
jgi:beta-lactamase class D